MEKNRLLNKEMSVKMRRSAILKKTAYYDRSNFSLLHVQVSPHGEKQTTEKGDVSQNEQVGDFKEDSLL